MDDVDPPLPPHIRRFAPWTWSCSVRVALAVVLVCLYAPFSWVLIVRDWTWIKMWPVLPGLVPGAFFFHQYDDVVEFTAMGVVSLILIAGLTWLGSRGRWQLVLATIIAVLIAAPSAWIGYSLYLF
jgi:hypothetical protein